MHFIKAPMHLLTKASTVSHTHTHTHRHTQTHTHTHTGFLPEKGMLQVFCFFCFCILAWDSAQKLAFSSRKCMFWSGTMQKTWNKTCVFSRKMLLFQCVFKAKKMHVGSRTMHIPRVCSMFLHFAQANSIHFLEENARF